MHILPQALLVSLLATAPAVPGTSVLARQDQAPAQVQGDLERAVEREHLGGWWHRSFPSDVGEATCRKVGVASRWEIGDVRLGVDSFE
ncbi:MAG: hypothetical protein P8N31_13650, partial [Planctomycetota bacterium]|nr:hypothetical protein [Planctomycetota bacterium]